jgi:hypothetical protein
MTGPRLGPDGQAWGQYPNDPVVERVFKSDEQVNQFPHLCVCRAPGSSMEILSGTGGAVGVRHYFRVSIIGYTETKDGVLAGTWLERLWDDVHTTLMAHNTLGGCAEDVKFEGTEDDYDEDQVKAGFRQDVVVWLYESKALAA